MDPALTIALGIAGLVVSSGVAVSAGSRIARRLGVSALVVGLTITSIGTSLPEIATNVAAAMSGAGGLDASGLAVGNVIGSNLSQITLLLGVTALAAPMEVPRRALGRDGAMMSVALGAMFAACLDRRVEIWEGWALIALYAAYLVLLLRGAQAERDPPKAEPGAQKRWGLAADLALLLGGLAGVVFSADALVGAGVEIAERLAISPSLVGLLVGLGTGLPELTVALRAAMSDAPELGLGNLIGSNITDPLLSFGAGAALHPISVPEVALRFDFPWWAAATAIALLVSWDHRDLNRREGGVLVLLFALFAYQRAFVLEDPTSWL